MKSEPILAQGTIKGEQFTVYGGLHYIKGNHAPYFTLTYWAFVPGRKNSTEHGGAGHDEILKYFPQFADLAALHLSDIDGVPMHAVENGWYWLGKTKWEKRDNAILARHLRISEQTAAGLDFDTKQDFADYVKSQYPRWKQEALDCIARHNLEIFGDNGARYTMKEGA